MTDPTIEAARDILGDSLRELRKAVDGCSAADLNRRPIEGDTNPLAVLVTHAMQSTRSWLSIATGAPPPERDRDAEFLVVVDDAAAFLTWLDGISAECRALLDGDVAYDPGATVTAPWRAYGADEPLTAAWGVLHARARGARAAHPSGPVASLVRYAGAHGEPGPNRRSRDRG